MKLLHSCCFKKHVSWKLILCLTNQSTLLDAEHYLCDPGNVWTWYLWDEDSVHGIYPFLVISSPLPGVVAESSDAECTLVKSQTRSIRHFFPKDLSLFSLSVFVSSVLSWSSFPFLLVWDSFPIKPIAALENQSSNWGWSREIKLLPLEFCWWFEAILIHDSSTYTAALVGARQHSW